MPNNQKNQKLFLVVVGWLLLNFSMCCVAQGIEEVVIQAEQIEDTSLDDLVSSSVLSGEKLADAGIGNVEDVAAYVPNLVLTETDTGTNIVIRGIGAGVNQGFDQSVGLYIDGVPLPRSQMARAPFLDLGNVQVLRGPQYVNDGNFSIAGSVHMITNQVTEEFEAGIDFNYLPSQNDKKMLLTASLPLSDSYGVRFALQSQKSSGYIENVTRQEDGPQRDELIGRFVFTANPTDALNLKFKLEKGRFDTVGRQIEIIQSAPVPNVLDPNGPRGPSSNFVGTTTPATIYTNAFDHIYYPLDIRYDTGFVEDPLGIATPEQEVRDFYFLGQTYLGLIAGQYETAGESVPAGLLDSSLNFKRGADFEEFSNNDSLNISFNADYWLGESQISLVASRIEYELDEQIDSDFTAAPLLESNQQESYEQNFYKISFKSEEGNFLEIAAGASYLDAHLEFDSSVLPRVNPAIDYAVYNDSNTDTTGALDALKNSVLVFDPKYPLETFFGRQQIGSSPGFQPVRAFKTAIPFREFEQDSTIKAAFLSAKINWSDVFRTTLGARYTHSQKKAKRDLALLKPNGEALSNADVLGNTTESLDQIADLVRIQYRVYFGVETHTSVPGTDYALPDLKPALTGKRTEEKLLPSISAEWDVTPDLTLLASARMANKLGGFDARSNATPEPPSGRGVFPGSFEFEDENAITYELGAKWYLPRGFGELHATAFYTQFEDLQISVFDGRSGFNVINAGEAETAGIEIEGLLQPTDAFNINYSIAWIDFQFTDYQNGPCHISRRPDFIRVGDEANSILVNQGFRLDDLLPINYNVNYPVLNSSNGGATTSSSTPFDFINQKKWAAHCDFNGQTNQYVAEWQGTVSFNYEIGVVNLGLFKPTLDVLYNNGYHTTSTQDPDAYQDAYFQFNGRLALVSFEDVWQVALTGENLTNQKIVTYANELPLAVRAMGSKTHYGFVRSPRAIGLNFRYNFY